MHQVIADRTSQLVPRRREHNARSLTRPWVKDFRDEFNQLRNQIPVDDRELHNARPVRSIINP